MDERKIHTVSNKIIRAFAIILAIFLLFDLPIFIIIMLDINSIKPKDHDLTNIYFIKIAYIY